MNDVKEWSLPKALTFPKILLRIVILLISVSLISSIVWLSLHYFKTKNSQDTPTPPVIGYDENTGISSGTEEMRGVFIASVININFPSETGLSAKKLKSEINDIINTCESAGLNTIFFQVRPSSDALYKSEIFPSSEYVTENQGDELPFDILEYFIKAAHKKGIKVHAWVNPLRITMGSASSPQQDTEKLAENNPARLNPQWTVAYADGRLYYNPGLPEVRDLVCRGVAEIAVNYDVDGIIFDDYFYPYPVISGNTYAAFDDKEAYEMYGNGASLDDWRRENVNTLVKECYEEVKRIDQSLRFGIAPFGIWQNDNGTNGGSATAGLEAYKSIYCDALAWIDGGYIDYIAPQLYWQFSNSAAPFGKLARWWNAAVDGTDVDLYISHGVYNYANWTDPQGEFTTQVGFARSESCYKGSILYGYDALKNNVNLLFDEVSALYSEKKYVYKPESNNQELKIQRPANGSYIDAAGIYLLGTSDPSEPLYLDGKKVSRTSSGYFSVYLKLDEGENKFVFSHKDKQIEYFLNRGTPPVSPSTGSGYAKLNGYEITSVSPSYNWTAGLTTLAVSAVAPSGSDVVAVIDGRSFKLSPTINPPDEGKYMKEIYTGTVKFTLPESGVRELGRIKFTATRKNETSTAESGEIRLLASGTTIPVTVKENDTEMKLSPGSWYYDDYSPQSAGMCDNALYLSGGYYKLSCGGFIAEDEVEELSREPFGLATVSSAVMTKDSDAVYLSFASDVNMPVNGCVINDEFIITLYNINAETAPQLQFCDNLLFDSYRQEKSTKANAYKYYFKLRNVENFYGYRYYYEDGKLVVRITNPTTISGGKHPLSGKTIVVDAGHGGNDSGAIGPAPYPTEAQLNLAVAKAAAEKLKELGAEVILIRSEDDQTVAINDRIRMLCEIMPDLSISIHQNSVDYSSDITQTGGVLGLYYADSGLLLSKTVASSVAEAFNRRLQPVKNQRLAMVRNYGFPSTLVEVSFMTSVEEFEQMTSPEAAEKAGQAVADGVLDFYEAQKKYIIR